MIPNYDDWMDGLTEKERNAVLNAGRVQAGEAPVVRGQTPAHPAARTSAWVMADHAFGNLLVLIGQILLGIAMAFRRLGEEAKRLGQKYQNV